MITIVDVTGTNKFGYGNTSVIVGTLTPKTSTLMPVQIVSTGIQQLYKFAGMISPLINSAEKQFIVNRLLFSRVKSMILINSESIKPEIWNYKFSGFNISRIGSYYAMGSNYFSALKSRVLTSFTVANPEYFSYIKSATLMPIAFNNATRFSFVLPASTFNIDAVTKIYKYAGIKTPSIQSSEKQFIQHRFMYTYIKSMTLINSESIKPEIWNYKFSTAKVYQLGTFYSADSKYFTALKSVDISTYIIARPEYFTYLKPIAVYNAESLNKVYKYAGMIVPKMASTFVNYLMTTKYDGIGLKSPSLNTISILKDISKFAGIVTPKIFSAIILPKIRYDFAGMNAVSFVSFLYKFANNLLDRVVTSTVVPAKTTTVSNLKGIYVFSGMNIPKIGTTLNSAKFQYDFAGMLLPKVFSIKYRGSDITLDKVFISPITAALSISIPFQNDSNQFTITALSTGAIVTYKTYLENISKISPVLAMPVISAYDASFGAVFNGGSGFDKTSIISYSPKNLILDYNTVQFSGLRLAKILSAPPTSWQLNTGIGASGETLIQFWS